MLLIEPRVPMPVERPTTVYLDDEAWLTVQTTPVHLDEWALGYLFGEGVIGGAADLARLVVDEDRGLVWAARRPGAPAPAPPGEAFAPVTHPLQASADQVIDWLRQMLAAATLYAESRGIHAAMAVRADTGERFVREDIGRHNAVDKVIGACLKAGWPAAQVVILASGRISYEMCSRLARFGAGIGVSRTAATDQAYELAMHCGIELVGYARSPASLVVYTEGKRIMGRVTTAWS